MRNSNSIIELKENSEECYFDGLCMMPGQSWNAQMELEHWNRYMTFLYLAESVNVLDAACGEGYGTHLLSSIAKKAIGIDLSKSNIRHAVNKYKRDRTNLNYIVSDVCNPSIVDEKFDVIYSFETIEHLNDIDAFLLSLSEVISDDGAAIISTPKPNIDPATHRPYNPHHVHELAAEEFYNCLSEYFRHVELAGQSKEFPCEIHQQYDNDNDAYAIGIVSNQEEITKKIMERLPDKNTLSIRENLFRRHANRIKNFTKPLRILFVPLTNPDCENPSDRRRVLLPANFLREYGAEVAIVKKEDTLKIGSNIILTQNREYEFWLDNIELLKKKGRHLVFSFSDALGITTKSKAHSYEAFSGIDRQSDVSFANGTLKLFLKKCFSHVFAGSVIQKQIISELAPGISVSVLNDPIDTETYNTDLVQGGFKKDSVLTLIWEGFYDNVPYLLACAEPIKNMSKRIPLRLIVTTSQNRRNKFLGTNDNEELTKIIFGDIAEFHVWSRQTISQLMAASDIGLAPLFMNCSFAQAKPSNKAAIYNYMKLPVICSPTVAFESYIQNEFNGFVAHKQSDWEKYIEYLYNFPEKCHRMGLNGYNKAIERYSINAISRQMLRVFMALS